MSEHPAAVVAHMHIAFHKGAAMIHFTMQAAGCVAAVSALFESTRDYCNGWLCSGQPDFAVAITPQDIAFEREKSLRRMPWRL